MSRARDDRRRNIRREFALYHDDDERTQVGVTSLVEADGCCTVYGRDGSSEWRRVLAFESSEVHEPGTHVLDGLIPIHGGAA